VALLLGVMMGRCVVGTHGSLQWEIAEEIAMGDCGGRLRWEIAAGACVTG